MQLGRLGQFRRRDQRARADAIQEVRLHRLQIQPARQHPQYGSFKRRKARIRERPLRVAVFRPVVAVPYEAGFSSNEAATK
ncbi:MAG: hypothetical protein ACREPJ_02125 [Rhodanobacteraceae bacterium]